MKKFIFTIAILGAMTLASCGGKTNENTEVTNDTIEAVIDSVAPDGEQFVSEDTVEVINGTIVVNPTNNE